MIVLKSTKFYCGIYQCLRVPQYCYHMHCLQYEAERKFSNPLYSSVCELGEQLCHQYRAMSCTPSIHISPLICEHISQIFRPRRRESEQIFFLCLDQEMDVWWGLVSVYSPHPHLTTYCLFLEFVKGQNCAVNLTSTFKEAERKQSEHSRVGKTENCSLVISTVKCCIWSYSYRLLGPELRQVGKVVILHYK